MGRCDWSNFFVSLSLFLSLILRYFHYCCCCCRYNYCCCSCSCCYNYDCCFQPGSCSFYFLLSFLPFFFFFFLLMSLLFRSFSSLSGVASSLTRNPSRPTRHPLASPPPLLLFFFFWNNGKSFFFFNRTFTSGPSGGHSHLCLLDPAPPLLLDPFRGQYSHS